MVRVVDGGGLGQGCSQGWCLDLTQLGVGVRIVGGIEVKVGVGVTVVVKAWVWVWLRLESGSGL